MADSKITALASIGTGTDPANDPLVIVDVSDILPGGMSLTGTTKKVTLNNLLACSPTATLASATITGDLTVDTNTLYVNSSTNNVGLGTLTPSGASGRALEIYGGAGQSRIVLKNDTTGSASTDGSQIALVGSQLVIQNREASEITFETNNTERYRLASDGVATWSNVGGVAGTAMTLNSTGLGVGVTSPSYRIHSVVTSGFAGGFRSSTAVVGGILCGNSLADLIVGVDASGNGRLTADTSKYLGLGSGGINDRVILDSSGNVGIGVTPSAWGGSYKALQLQSVARNIAATGAGLGDFTIAFNAIYDSTDSRWEYAATGDKAGRYSQTGSGNHRWFVSNTAGTAGNEITDFASPAMMLDASGNLNLGVTSSLINTTRRLSVSGTVAAALQSTGAATVETINVWHTATSGNNIFVDFDTEAAVTSRGSISYNRAGGLVAYNTTSDYRAKDIIGPVSNSGSLIDSLKVYAGKMKGATIERPMLIAHEAQEVAPYAVTGTKDEVDADGKPKYQQMDASALVPLLIAEIQSLRARVQTLETR